VSSAVLTLDNACGTVANWIPFQAHRHSIVILTASRLSEIY